MMWKDPIVEEVRAIREAYGKEFDFDIRRIGKDLQNSEKKRLAAEKRAATRVRAAKGGKKPAARGNVAAKRKRPAA